MSNSPAKPTLTNVTFIGNSASENGGAMYNGGVASRDSDFVLKNVTFSDNSASSGGAIYNYPLRCMIQFSLTDVIFTNNSASGNGGALFNTFNEYGGSATFFNVLFSGNSAALGGAIYNRTTDTAFKYNFINVVFSGNSATSGGAISNFSYQYGSINSELTNVTFSANSAIDSGGALYSYGETYGGCDLILKNVILWGNSATNGTQIYNYNNRIYGTTLDVSYSTIQGGVAGISNNGGYSSVTDGGNNIDADPLFINPVPASSAPTTAGDYHLKSGSPAIDAGSNAAVSSIATDPDGNPRVSGSSADMGAYELPFYTVRFKASPSDGGTVSVSTQVIPSGGQTWPVTAIPSAGYKFLNWTGPGGFTTTSSNPMTSVNVTSNMTIIANFQPFTISNNKAIIVAGGGDYSTNAIWDDTETNADYAHGALLFQGYSPEKIHYLSAGSNLTSPVDGFASRQNLQNAIQSWAGDADNLLIYMVDHGGYETFKINETEILRVSELDTWLDYIQQIIPGQVILIYDACESGSFIGRLNPPADRKRAVVVSSEYDEQAVFASEGTFSFSWNFWSQIYAGFSFYQAFLNAQNTMELSRSQHSLIDADGNGVPGEKADSAIAADIRIGDGIATGADFPLIGSVSVSPQTLSAGTSATIYAENVIDSDGIKKVWAAITPPKNTVCYAADVPVTSLPITELRHTGNNRYEAIYSDFSMKGIYKIAVFATDNRNFTSIPDLQKHVVYVTQTQDFSPPVKKGDISGDNQVNLTDVISALQILSGLNPSQIRCDYSTSGADVNGDGRVGLQEVIYILQTVAGLR
jgi:predicted outer membrane repeat protein